tara:strand:- start:214 stop:399 length:186 start_codon:yes stop_codon:yes gene_type:complete
MKDAKMEILQQEVYEYKQELLHLKEHIRNDTGRRKESKNRGTVPWDEPYERRGRYPPSGYD